MLLRLFKWLFFCGLLIATAGAIYLFYLYQQVVEDLEDKLIHYSPNLTTQVFDKKGELIANLYRKEHRIFVPYDEIPTRVIETLVATEDIAFFEHSGIYPEGMLRAFIKNLKAKRIVEGASTITQQLIKIQLLTRKKTYTRKIKEVLLALRLEYVLDKEDILERYINQVYFGHGYYGIKTAAIGYFRKNLNQLSIKEIAMLIGSLKAPSLYDPTKNYKRSIKRANLITLRLKNLGWIDNPTFIKAFQEEPIVFNENISQNKAPYAIDYLKYYLKDNISDLYTGGYEFQLSLDLDIQKLAKESLKYGYDGIKRRDGDKNTTSKLNGAIVVMENSTGYILGLVGGVDYKKSPFNRAFQSKRQSGSSLKPFIYQVALEKGYGLNSQIADISRTYEYQLNEQNLTWRPKNAANNVKGLIDFQESLVYSRNLATINLTTDLGLETVYNSLSSYGFKNIPRDLSISLGSFGVSVLDMAEAYSIFSNYGKKIKSRFIISATKQSKGEVIYRKEEQHIIEPEQAYLMISMLKEVIKRGSGKRAYLKDIELAGKTGTTNDNADAWFTGFSPSIQTMIWYGNDDNSPMSEGGGRAAGPAFAYFYKNLLKLYPHIPREFKRPKKVYKKGKYFFTEQSKLETKAIIPQNNLVF